MSSLSACFSAQAARSSLNARLSPQAELEQERITFGPLLVPTRGPPPPGHVPTHEGPPTWTDSLVDFLQQDPTFRRNEVLAKATAAGPPPQRPPAAQGQQQRPPQQAANAPPQAAPPPQQLRAQGTPQHNGRQAGTPPAQPHAARPGPKRTPPPPVHGAPAGPPTTGGGGGGGLAARRAAYMQAAAENKS